MLERRYFTLVWDWVKRFFSNNVHFLQLHYTFFLVYIFFFSALYYCQPGTTWSYIDALFMATTGCTNTGLNTIALSSFTMYQTMILFFSSFFGSHVGISLIVVLVRRRYFSKRFEDVLLFNKARRMREEHKRRRTHRRALSTAIPSAPLHLRKLRRSSMTSMFENGSAPHPYANPPAKMHSSAIDAITTTTTAPAAAANTDLNNHRPQSLNIYTNTNDQSSIIDNNDLSLQLICSSPGEISNRNSLLQEEIKTSDHEYNGGSTTSFSSDEKNNTNSNTDNNNENNNKTNDSNENDINIDHKTQVDNHSGIETTGIAFADNIERQREMARQRLVQDRRFREALDRITHQPTPTRHDYDEEAGAGLNESEYDDDDEIEKIMREPIDKSQLTREQRYRIGGAEYQALDILVHLVPIYYIGTVILFGFFFRIYIACSTYAQEVLRTSNPTGPIDPWHFSFFQSLSSFNNLGIMLLDSSMVPFQNAPAPLLLTIFLILCGNTAYAINLRFIIWCLYKLTPSSRHMRREALRYLLDHPRRCYTTLFPSTQTYWLLFTLIVITLVELTSFLALNYWLPVLDGVTSGARFLDGLFQSVATRNAGFSVINLMEVNPGTQLVYIVAMYISVYPVAISMRNSNVYQERALGIYRGANDDDDFSSANIPATGPALVLKLRRHPTMNSVVTTGKKIIRRPDFFVVTQIQRQLSSDISWLIACLFVIVVLEAQRIMDPSPITVWTVIYECVSAFGNVGASTGYPNLSVSQCGEYRTLSKLVLILLMYRGRHRGLPASIDRAVMLPSDQLEEKEAEEQIFKRRNTVVSQTLNSTTSGNNSGIAFPNTFFYRSTP